MFLACYHWADWTVGASASDELCWGKEPPCIPDSFVHSCKYPNTPGGIEHWAISWRIVDSELATWECPGCELAPRLEDVEYPYPDAFTRAS